MANHPRFNIITVVFGLFLTTTFGLGIRIMGYNWDNLGVSNDHRKAEVVSVLIVLGFIASLSLLYYGLVLSLMKVTTASVLSSFLTLIVGCALFIYAATAPPYLYLTFPLVILTICLKAFHLAHISPRCINGTQDIKRKVSGYFRRMAIALGVAVCIALVFSVYMDFNKRKSILDYFSNDSSVSEIQRLLEEQKSQINLEAYDLLSEKLNTLKKKDTIGQISVFLIVFLIGFAIYLYMRRLYAGNLSQTELVKHLEESS